MKNISDGRAIASTGAGVSRRTIMKGAAWAVPVIMIAAPAQAYAASECHPSTNLQGLQVGSKPGSITFYDVDNQPTGIVATLSYDSKGQPSKTPGNTGRVSQTTSSPSWKYLNVQMVSRLNQGDYVDVTFTFSQPVTGLSFIVHDIDKKRSNNQTVNWVDQVIVQSGLSAFTYAGGTAITGNGTSGNPFTSNRWGDLPIETGQGSVRITFPGEVTKVTIRYQAGQDGNASSQHIGIGDLSYESCLPAGAKSLAPMSRGAAQPQLAAPYGGDLSILDEQADDAAEDR